MAAAATADATESARNSNNMALLEPASPQISTTRGETFTPWSPPGKMNVSPLQQHTPLDSFPATDAQDFALPTAGTTTTMEGASNAMPTAIDMPAVSEVTPLLLDVPPEIITTREAVMSSEDIISESNVNTSNRNDISTDTSTSIFTYMWKHTQDTSPQEQWANTQHASSDYATKSIVQRAWPGRSAALIPMFIVLLPTIAVIRQVVRHALCETTKVPYMRLTVWVAILPISLAVGTHIGTQTSQSTFYAIVFRQIRRETWWTWWRQELCTAVLLGLGCGTLLGTVAWLFCADGALALFAAMTQLASAMVVGMLGPFVPLLVSTGLAKAASRNDSNARTGERSLWCCKESVISVVATSVSGLLGTCVWWLVAHGVLFSTNGTGSSDEILFTTDPLLWEDERLSVFCN